MKHKLRMRGLRCHLMYCRNSTRMQVIPLLASRSQALRYLFIRWRLNVMKLKTLIMEGVVEKGSEEFLRTARSYQRDDIFPGNTPLIAYISGQATAQETANTLRQISGAGMLGNISIFHR